MRQTISCEDYYLRSSEYTNRLLKVADSLLKINDYPNNAQLIRLFNDYGIHVANVHQIHPYLKPFMFYGQNMGHFFFTSSNHLNFYIKIMQEHRLLNKQVGQKWFVL